jgi:hypothetical protein
MDPSAGSEQAMSSVCIVPSSTSVVPSRHSHPRRRWQQKQQQRGGGGGPPGSLSFTVTARLEAPANLWSLAMWAATQASVPWVASAAYIILTLCRAAAHPVSASLADAL